jgi:hypothetical protein
MLFIVVTSASQAIRMIGTGAGLCLLRRLKVEAAVIGDEIQTPQPTINIVIVSIAGMEEFLA